MIINVMQKLNNLGFHLLDENKQSFHTALIKATLPQAAVLRRMNNACWKREK